MSCNSKGGVIYVFVVKICCHWQGSCEKETERGLVQKSVNHSEHFLCENVNRDRHLLYASVTQFFENTQENLEKTIQVGKVTKNSFSSPMQWKKS